MKIAINRCYGGFGLSEAAVRRYAEIKGLTVYPEKRAGLATWWIKPPGERGALLEGAAFHAASLADRAASNRAWKEAQLYDRDLDRADPVLIQVIEELGSKAASGECGKLEVVEIPDGIDWEIDEYDGMEHIAEKHRTWS